MEMNRTLGCFLFGVAAQWLAAQPKQVSVIRSMIDAVSSASLAEDIRQLQSAGGHWSRVNFTSGNDSAVSFIRREFEALPGMTSVHLDTFYIANAVPPLNVQPLFNVVATLRGKLNPGKECVVGAHLDCSASRMGDSIWQANWQSIQSPGADDNATGVAAVLEMARIFADPSLSFQNDYTIKFIAFGAEESGPAYNGSLHGSTHYAAKAKERNDDIIAMLNLDMLGFNHQSLYADIASNPLSEWMGLQAIQINNAYSIGLSMRQPPFSTGAGSDHSAFWSQGYPAVLFIENYPPWQSSSFFQANPHYHRSSDTLGNLNVDLVKRFVQVGVGLTASLASPSLTDIADVMGTSRDNSPSVRSFPNPFNAETHIQVATQDYDHISVRITDVLGREVATLVEDYFSPGIHTLKWSARNAPSGIYFCVAAGSALRESLKLVVVK